MVSKKDPTAWLDNAFFEKVLRLALGDKSITVKDFFISLHTDASEQYASTIYRATLSYCIKGKIESLAVVIKLISSKVNQLADASSFENELNLYKNFISPMQSLLTHTGCTDVQLAPKLLYASTDPQPVMILEDATHNHYEVYKNAMNFENAGIVVEKLAKFHAASYRLLKDTSNKIQRGGSSGLFKTNPSQGVKFMEENFSIFTEEIDKWKGFDKYAEKFKNLIPNFLKRGTEIFNPETDKFNIKVLNHGDFHYNNMLVKFDSEQSSVLDVMFIDFQLSFWGTPAVDLYYLLYLVCNKEARDNHRKELICHYHKKLVETLDKLGHMGTVPTLLDINNELLKAGFLEVVVVVCFLPFLFADQGTAINVFSETQDAKAYRRQLYNSPQYREILEPLLPQFLHKGFLN